MDRNKIIITGTGCDLADFLYTGIDFGSPVFKQYLSNKPGDGGLSPGKLVFTEELEKFSEKSFEEVLENIAEGRIPDAFNLGGPGLVPLVHIAQLLGTEKYETRLLFTVFQFNFKKLQFQDIQITAI